MDTYKSKIPSSLVTAYPSQSLCLCLRSVVIKHHIPYPSLSLSLSFSLSRSPSHTPSTWLHRWGSWHTWFYSWPKLVPLKHLTQTGPIKIPSTDPSFWPDVNGLRFSIWFQAGPVESHPREYVNRRERPWYTHTGATGCYILHNLDRSSWTIKSSLQKEIRIK